MGPFAIRDLGKAVAAGRFHMSDPALVWRMSSHAIVGVSLAITSGRLSCGVTDEIVVQLLCMAGIEVDAARELAARPKPALAIRDTTLLGKTPHPQDARYPPKPGA